MWASFVVYGLLVKRAFYYYYFDAWKHDFISVEWYIFNFKWLIKNPFLITAKHLERSWQIWQNEVQNEKLEKFFVKKSYCVNLYLTQRLQRTENMQLDCFNTLFRTVLDLSIKF